MTVAELKKLLESARDDMVVLTNASDHSYREIDGQITTVVSEGHGYYSEFWGKQYVKGNEEAIDALVIG